MDLDEALEITGLQEPSGLGFRGFGVKRLGGGRKVFFLKACFFFFVNMFFWDGFY